MKLKLKKVQSIYIIRFYGTFVDKKGKSLVIQFAQFGSFETFIIKHKNIKFNLRICKDIIERLFYLQRNGIIHRDLKPDNVLIVNENIDADVCGKLTDFGSSRTINTIRQNMTLTKGIGTPVYLSPELLDQKLNKIY